MNVFNKEEFERSQQVMYFLNEIDHPNSWKLLMLPDNSFVIIQREKLMTSINVKTGKKNLFIENIPENEVINIYIDKDSYRIENNKVFYIYDTIEELMDSFFFTKLKSQYGK